MRAEGRRRVGERDVRRRRLLTRDQVQRRFLEGGRVLALVLAVLCVRFAHHIVLSECAWSRKKRRGGAPRRQSASAAASPLSLWNKLLLSELAMDADAALVRRLSHIQHVLLVLSGKGGVGKSSISVQLALALLAHDPTLRVGLLDVDLTGPSLPRMLGMEGRDVLASDDGWVPVYLDASKAVHNARQHGILPGQGDTTGNGGDEDEEMQAPPVSPSSHFFFAYLSARLGCRSMQCDTHSVLIPNPLSSRNRRAKHKRATRSRPRGPEASSRACRSGSSSRRRASRSSGAARRRTPWSNSFSPKSGGANSTGSSSIPLQVRHSFAEKLCDFPRSFPRTRLHIADTVLATGTSDEHISLLESLRPLLMPPSPSAPLAPPLPTLSALLVSTPQAVALLDVTKELSFVRRTRLPLLGLVENMSGYVCPHCSDIVGVFGTGGGEDFCRRDCEKRQPGMPLPEGEEEGEGCRFLGRVPIDPELVKLLDAVAAEGGAVEAPSSQMEHDGDAAQPQSQPPTSAAIGGPSAGADGGGGGPARRKTLVERYEAIPSFPVVAQIAETVRTLVQQQVEREANEQGKRLVAVERRRRAP